VSKKKHGRVGEGRRARERGEGKRKRLRGSSRGEGWGRDLNGVKSREGEEERRLGEREGERKVSPCHTKSVRWYIYGTSTYP
jgi:hypothetical protein